MNRLATYGISQGELNDEPTPKGHPDMSLSRTRTRSRTLAAVGLLAAAGLFLTACGTSTDDAGSGSATESSATSGSSSTPTSTSTSISDPTSTPASSPTSVPTDSPSDGPSQGTDASSDNRADGTVTGRLTFLAPGKLEVDGRPFYVATDTEIRGGDICGDPESQSAEKCTADELDAVAKDGNLTVEVSIEKGIAGRVTQV
ncbi:hypothetical protein M2283_002173 [Streptomyces pseudovenezuelae]|uniref:Uncharacterized protein n=2 Tax=Streptomyces pseudovenezuelae TaxID=67350 RepID=A0ABT6LF07_9ACTN|nr:hypothetical protein [Streptomyces pseudovenezuelae]